MKRPRTASAIINDELQADRNREFPSRDFQAGLLFALKAIRIEKRDAAKARADRVRGAAR